MLLPAAGLISMFVTVALIPMVMRVSLRLNVMDLPDARKVHARPIPRAGGLAMAAGAVLPVLLWAPLHHLVRGVLMGGGLLVLVGFADDFKGLSWRAKLLGQLAAALVVVIYGDLRITSLGLFAGREILLPPGPAMALSLLVIVGVTNAVNFADGLDGLAGGITLLGFMCLAYLGFSTANPAVALLSAAMVGAVFGFLRFNTVPARIFMGDAGSQLLGFMLATLSLALTQENTALSPFLPLFLAGLPVLDTLTVICERLKSGASPFLPDRRHLHHKLLKFGLAHAQAVFAIYTLQALMVLAGFGLRFHPDLTVLGGFITAAGLVMILLRLADIRTCPGQCPPGSKRLWHGWISRIAKQDLVLKTAFKALLWGMPGLFLATVWFSGPGKGFRGVLAAGMLAAIGLIWRFRPTGLGLLLRLCFYLLTPLLVLEAETGAAALMGPAAMAIYNLAYGLLVMCMLLTLRYTRRKNRFRPTPLDFLIVFTALALLLIPDSPLIGAAPGWTGFKIIFYWFGFEVLSGELRHDPRPLGMWMVCLLVAVIIRSVV